MGRGNDFDLWRAPQLKMLWIQFNVAKGCCRGPKAMFAPPHTIVRVPRSSKDAIVAIVCDGVARNGRGQSVALSFGGCLGV